MDAGRDRPAVDEGGREEQRARAEALAQVRVVGLRPPRRTLGDLSLVGLAHRSAGMRERDRRHLADRAQVVALRDQPDVDIRPRGRRDVRWDRHQRVVTDRESARLAGCSHRRRDVRDPLERLRQAELALARAGTVDVRRDRLRAARRGRA